MRIRLTNQVKFSFIFVISSAVVFLFSNVILCIREMHKWLSESNFRFHIKMLNYLVLFYMDELYGSIISQSEVMLKIWEKVETSFFSFICRSQRCRDNWNINKRFICVEIWYKSINHSDKRFTRQIVCIFFVAAFRHDAFDHGSLFCFLLFQLKSSGSFEYWSKFHSRPTSLYYWQITINSTAFEWK